MTKIRIRIGVHSPSVDSININTEDGYIEGEEFLKIAKTIEPLLESSKQIKFIEKPEPSMMRQVAELRTFGNGARKPYKKKWTEERKGELLNDMKTMGRRELRKKYDTKFKTLKHYVKKWREPITLNVYNGKQPIRQQ